MTLARAVALLMVVLALTGMAVELSSVATEPPAPSSEAPAALAVEMTAPDPPSASEIDDGETEAAFLGPVLTR